MKTMRINRRYKSFCVLLLCIPAVYGQRVYTLDECIRLAEINNVKMKTAENEIKMAERDLKEAQSKYIPEISATGVGFMANKGLVEMSMAPGVDMSMFKNGVIGGVTAMVPLYTGGQIINGNKLAEVGVEVKQLQWNMTGNQVCLTTEQYYWQIIQLKEKLKTLDCIEEQLTNIHKDVAASVDAGLVTRNDLLQVELKRNETLSTRLQVENGLAVTKNLLAQYIGVNADSIDIVSDVDKIVSETPDSIYCDHLQALQQTNEYDLLQKNVKAGKLQYKMAVGKNMPTVAVGGGYMCDNFMDKKHPFWVGMASVSVPISGWIGGSQAMKKQKLQIQNNENQLNDQSQLLVINMQNAWNNLKEAYKQIDVARMSIDQASENLRMNKDFYAAGTTTMSDLLDAQSIYQQCRDKYVEAVTSYELKKREYLQATGRK